jgi:hypothetical protein
MTPLLPKDLPRCECLLEPAQKNSPALIPQKDTSRLETTLAHFSKIPQPWQLNMLSENARGIL